jgi:hypothetical protein
MPTVILLIMVTAGCSRPWASNCPLNPVQFTGCFKAVVFSGRRKLNFLHFDQNGQLYFRFHTRPSWIFLRSTNFEATSKTKPKIGLVEYMFLRHPTKLKTSDSLFSQLKVKPTQKKPSNYKLTWGLHILPQIQIVLVSMAENLACRSGPTILLFPYSENEWPMMSDSGNTNSAFARILWTSVMQLTLMPSKSRPNTK